MALRFEDAVEGLNINKATVFSVALSAGPVGSAHHLLRDGLYVAWADQSFALFMTNAATDPTAVPASQPAPGDYWPGALTGSGQTLQFQMDSGTLVQFGVHGPLTPTGFRAWTLAAAGTLYLTEFKRATL